MSLILPAPVCPCASEASGRRPKSREALPQKGFIGNTRAIPLTGLLSHQIDCLMSVGHGTEIIGHTAETAGHYGPKCPSSDFDAINSLLKQTVVIDGRNPYEPALMTTWALTRSGSSENANAMMAIIPEALRNCTKSKMWPV